MTLVKMSTIPTPGLTRDEQLNPTKEYRGFSIEKDNWDHQLYKVKNKETGEYLPGKFNSRRTIEAEVNAILAVKERDTKLSEITNGS